MFLRFHRYIRHSPTCSIFSTFFNISSTCIFLDIPKPLDLARAFDSLSNRPRRNILPASCAHNCRVIISGGKWRNPFVSAMTAVIDNRGTIVALLQRRRQTNIDRQIKQILWGTGSNNKPQRFETSLSKTHVSLCHWPDSVKIDHDTTPFRITKRMPFTILGSRTGSPERLATE